MLMALADQSTEGEQEVRSCTLMGGWGPGGGGGTSSVLRIQNGNSFTTLVPYDLDTVTLNRYL